MSTEIEDWLSIRKTLKISSALIISILSSAFMSMIDRAFIGHYDKASFEALAPISNICLSLYMFAVGLISIAEIFVGKVNGAKLYNKAAIPVWQMIYLSFILFFIFVCFGVIGGMIIDKSSFYLAKNYYTVNMYGSIFLLLVTSINSFFIGLGKVRNILIISILSNIANAIIDPILIFGSHKLIDKFHLNNPILLNLLQNINIPEYGVKGGALASIISQSLNLIIILFVFWNKENRKTYNTLRSFRLNKHLLKYYTKLGLPVGLGSMFEYVIWSILGIILFHAGPVYATIAAVVQVLDTFIHYIYDALETSTTVITSNILGLNKKDRLKDMLSSLFKIHLFIVACLAFVVFGYTDFLLKIIFDTNGIPESTILAIKYGLYGVVIYSFIDGFAWIYSGVITAGGDTLFTMLTNGCNLICFGLLLPYYMFKYHNIRPEYIWFGVLWVYPAVNMICFILRYNSWKWYKIEDG